MVQNPSIAGISLTRLLDRTAKARPRQQGARGVANGCRYSGITSVAERVNLTGNSINQNFNRHRNIASGLSTTTGFNISAHPSTAQTRCTDAILTCDPTKNLGPHQWLNGNCFQIPTVPGKNGPTVLLNFFGPCVLTSDLSLFQELPNERTTEVHPVRLLLPITS